MILVPVQDMPARRRTSHFKRCFVLRCNIYVIELKRLYGAATRSEGCAVRPVVVLCFQLYEILLYKRANWSSIILRDRSVTSYMTI